MDLTIWIAGYAAVLATVGAAYQVRSWWRDREHVEVRVKYSTWPSALSGPQFFISVVAINKGNIAVGLQSAGFQLEEEGTLYHRREVQDTGQALQPLNCFLGGAIQCPCRFWNWPRN